MRAEPCDSVYSAPALSKVEAEAAADAGGAATADAPVATSTAMATPHQLRDA